MVDQLVGGMGRRYMVWLVVIFAVAAVALYSARFGPIFRHRTEIPAARSVVRIARTISPAEVKEIFINFDGPDGTIVFLRYQEDFRDIERVVNSLKRVTVADRECSLGGLGATDKLVVRLKKSGRGVNFWGRYDPARAPIISESMRSDDLSALLYDICRRRGIEPRRR